MRLLLNNRLFKLILVFIIIIFIIGVPILVDIFSVSNIINKDSETEVVRTPNNSGFKLICDNSTGNFTITDISTNQSFMSYPDNVDNDLEVKNIIKSNIKSTLLISVLNYKTNSLSIINSNIGSVKQGGLGVEKTTSGYSLSYFFPNEKITVVLNLTLTETGFKIFIDPSKIKEDSDFHVMDITILPYFMATNGKKEGYYLIPDGSGALVNYISDKSQNLVYDEKVYQSDSSMYKESEVTVNKGIKLPIFGAKDAGSIVLGIISKGAADAKILVNSDGSKSNYKNICTQFILREVDKLIYNDNRSDVDLYQKTPIALNEIEITYILKFGINLSYVDMAISYRNYLINEFKLKKQNLMELPLHIDLFGATIVKKQFLGVPLDAEQSLTTYKQANEIINQLSNSGIKKLVLQYHNWTNETIWGKPPKNLTLDGKLGNKNDFNKLKDTVKNLGYDFFGNINITNVYMGSTILSPLYEFAKNMRKEPIDYLSYKINIYTENTSKDKMHLLRTSRISAYANKYSKNLSSVDISVGLDAGNTLYRDFSDNETSLSKTQKAISYAASIFKKDSGKLISNGGYDYLLKYTDYIVDAPSCDSGYDITDMEIPFYQIALHGLINYSYEPINSSSNQQDLFLKCVETGASIRYKWIYEKSDSVRNSRNDDLFYTYYGDWFQDCVSKYNDINKSMGATANQFITNHKKIADNVFMTTYEDSSIVIVNYNVYAYKSDFGEIPAKNYIVTKETINK